MAKQTIEQRLAELGIELPPAQDTPSGMNFIKAQYGGHNHWFLSGHLPTGPDGNLVYQGKVGAEVSVEDAYQAARLTALNLLATIKASVGSLERVTKLIKVLGMVNAVEGFGQQPQVINGASDLFVQVFGEKIGKHARSAVGVGGLPSNAPVEIEMIIYAKHPNSSKSK
jgi:enamine deaminase RidA (YjgF/YER057c/UK114 family)